MQTIPSILRERDISPPAWTKDTQLIIPAYQREDAKAIDLMGLKAAHVLIPPTLHTLASQQAGHPVHYKWIPFPGTDKVLTLSDVSPDELPELEPYHLMLLYQWAKNPSTAIWKYLNQTSAGDHHQPMLSATTYMWHEMFRETEIEAICFSEAERSADTEDKVKDRHNEIRIAISKLKSKHPDQRPARQAKNASVKVPLDRLIADSLLEIHGRDNLAYFNNVAYFWDGLRWKPIQRIDHPANPWHAVTDWVYRNFAHAGAGHIKSGIKLFTEMISTQTPEPNHGYIPFQNGLLDVHSLTLRPIERSDYILNIIPWEWQPEAKAPLWEKFLHHLMDPPDEYCIDGPELREQNRQMAIDAVEEFFGYCLTRSHDFQKMLYLIGKPDTGKSVLFKTLNLILPPGWSSNVAMDALGEPNSRLQMINTYYNVASEVGRRSRDVDDILLRVTAGEHVEIKMLYSNKVQIVLPTRLIFVGNLPPDTTDGTGAIQRRMLMVRTTDNKPENKQLEYEKSLAKEAQGILAKLVKAYARLLDRGSFLPPYYAQQITEQIKNESNSALLWVTELTRPPESNEWGSANRDLFDSYSEFCEANNLYKLSSVQWGKQLTGIGISTFQKKLPGNNVINARKLMLRSSHREATY